MNRRDIVRVLSLCLVLMTCLVSTAIADIAKGSKGEEVRQVQQKLYELGYLTGSIDGVFGNGTEKAVMEFQRAEGLAVTGVVDSKTLKRLDNPSAHQPYFHKAMLELSISYQVGDMGKNNRGGDVDWVMDLIVPYESWMEDHFPKITLGWADDPVDASIDYDWMPAWNNAKKGITSYQFSEGYWWDKNNNEYEVYYHMIFLPDDPNLAGRRWIEMECMGDKAIVYFTLEYKGDYTTGTGWRLKDVSFENTTVASVNSSGDDETTSDDGVLSAKDALQNIDVYGGCGWTGDKSDMDYYNIGRNQNGDDVYYGMSMFVEGAPAEFTVGAVSWTDQTTYSEDWLDSWKRCKKGETVVGSYFYDQIQSDGSRVTQSGVDIYLPDNPLIAGEQWFTLVCEDQRALVRVKLSYNGDYENGTGWDVELLETIVNTIG